ncbi:glutathione peroxidase [Vibrio viridaestus]|uniref:Glutathione peroxidase n=1 Tax=Vibrio viridaestus TaxID=2487322 RepID=A0A3N9TCX8_9VIBR|nr:glutathione peroxidase [Vibrio viridaestus]RQW62037.1 glutathione peroxidase [Vibrio viridaestus]
MSAHDFSVKTADGNVISLKDFKNKVLLVVNTASQCGFTPQYENLQKLYLDYKDKGLDILAFPCNQFGHQEPGSEDEIKSFCTTEFGVSFPLMAKVDVRGESAIPLFQYLSEAKPFSGFDKSHPITEKLQSALEKNFPEYLEGNGIKWNFTKFLINKDGEVVGRYEPTADPLTIANDIDSIL